MPYTDSVHHKATLGDAISLREVFATDDGSLIQFDATKPPVFQLYQKRAPLAPFVPPVPVTLYDTFLAASLTTIYRLDTAALNLTAGEYIAVTTATYITQSGIKYTVSSQTDVILIVKGAQ